MVEISRPWVHRLALGAAALGGFMLILLAIMTGISIIGRAFLWAGLNPVKGDFELVEAGIAFAVAAFMPWCQLQRGHASVTLFTDRFGTKFNAIVDLLGDVLLTSAAGLFLWRHMLGMLSKQQYGETTFILQYPLWWAYAASLFGLAVWVITGLWCVAADMQALGKGERRVTASRTSPGASQ